jgi:hypothetical protein
MKDNFLRNSGFSKIFVLIGILVLIISLTVATKLVSQKQENRSKAVEKNIQTIMLETPYFNSQTKSFKGNIHCHSNISDGVLSPTDVFKYYQNLNYDFIALTDHHNYPSDNSSEIRSLQENNTTGINLLTIPGMERYMGDESNNGHVNTLSSSVLVEELNQSGVGINPSEFSGINNTINKIRIINHPNSDGKGKEYWTDVRLATLQDYNGVEVWNHILAVDVWDKLLSSDKKIWGFASDDCHDYGDDLICGTSFIRVFADVLTRDDIFSNIKNGNFYSEYIPKGQSDIDLNISINNGIITVNTDIGSTIQFISANSKLEKITVNDTNLSYSPRGDEKYIRVEIIRLGPNSRAWSNPIFIKTLK